jgi:hypothetical protein
MDQDPDWGWTMHTLASLVSKVTNRNLIPFELRERLWKILEPLTHDPEPSPESEKDKEGDLVDDAYSLAINTTRGEAMVAVFEYALWVYRNLEKKGASEKLNFNTMPEVSSVLEKHLNPESDPSIAIRAVYGRFFPWLLLMDRKWTISHLDDIFPPGKFGDPLYDAAWDTYVMYIPAYDEPFAVLGERYTEAVDNLGKVHKKRPRPTDRDKKLTEQLMAFYWRGKLPDKLLSLFWERANPEQRTHALDFIGRSIKNEKEPLEDIIIERLTALWNSRLSAAEAAEDKTPYQGEMATFGWWFASGKFDDKWSIEQYLRALEIGTKTQTEYFVSKRLIEITNSLPEETMKILGKLVLRDEPGWMVFGNTPELHEILSGILASSNAVAQEAAKNLVNRLVSRGHTEFEDLIKNP